MQHFCSAARYLKYYILLPKVILLVPGLLGMYKNTRNMHLHETEEPRGTQHVLCSQLQRQPCTTHDLRPAMAANDRESPIGNYSHQRLQTNLKMEPLQTTYPQLLEKYGSG